MKALAPFAAALCLAALPLILPQYWLTLMNFTGLAAIVVLGLVLLTGVGGMTSFGQAAFVGISAYTTAWFTTQAGLSPWLTLPLSLAVTASAALLIGLLTLGLRGHSCRFRRWPGRWRFSIWSATCRSLAAMMASGTSRPCRLRAMCWAGAPSPG